MHAALHKDGNDPVPVSFRYGVAPLASMKAWVFKPHSPAAAGEADTVKSGVLGAHYSGNFHKVIRNRRASVIWEAAMRHWHGSEMFWSVPFPKNRFSILW